MKPPAKVDPSDAAALAAWLAEARALLAVVRDHALEGTLKRPHRKLARGFCHDIIRRRSRDLAAHLDALDVTSPAEAGEK